MQDNPPLTAKAMPKRLAQAFQLLRRGKHVCRDDGAAFRDLERHEDRYRVVFLALGYQLIRHDRGFYYFQGDNTLPTVRLQAMTLFVLILFQELEEKKSQEPDRAWEKSLTSRIFHVDELPHFATAGRRDLMQSVGVTRANLNEKALRDLGRLGMLEMITPSQFRLRPPVYRFVDLCLKYADEDWLCTPESDEVDLTDDVTRLRATFGVVREVT